MIFRIPDDGSIYHNDKASINFVKNETRRSEIKQDGGEKMALLRDRLTAESKQGRSESLMKIIEKGKIAKGEVFRFGEIGSKEKYGSLVENSNLKRSVETENTLVEKHLKESAVFQTLARHIQKETEYPEEKYKNKMNSLFDQIDGKPIKEIDHKLNEFIEKRQFTASEYRKKRRLNQSP